MPKALLLYNPVAGRFPIQPFIHTADRALAECGWQVEVVETRSGEHATRMACQAAESSFDVVFASGGDGTISQVAAGLIGTDTALGVLPSGTANVWARELGLPVFNWARWWVLRDNVRLLAESPACPIDVGLCNGLPFVMWAGMGLDALTIHRIEPRVRLEKFFAVPEYAAATILNAAQWRGVTMRLWADGREVRGHYVLAVVNNIRHYMGGLANLSPDAYLDDGLLDLWLFAGDSLADALRHAFDLWAGRHVDSRAVQRIPVREVRFDAVQPFAVQADGEPVAMLDQATVTVRPRALKVLIPPKALDLLSHPPQKIYVSN